MIESAPPSRWRGVSEVVNWKDAGIFLLAVGIVSAGLFGYNKCVLAEIDATYQNHCVPGLFAAEDHKSALAHAVHELDWLNEKQAEYKWVKEWFEAYWNKPVRQQLLGLMKTAIVSTDQAEREELLRKQATGEHRFKGFPPFILEVDSATGSGLWQTQVNYNDGKLRETLADAPEIRESKAALGLQLASVLAASVRPKHRKIRRMNGAIQWMVLLLGCFLLLKLVVRFVRLLWTAASGNERLNLYRDVDLQETCRQLVDASGPAAEERHTARVRLRELLKDRFYGRIDTWVGLLPALGFIGTILGMGEALLKADELTTSTDRQAAIQEMTEQLGYAFDTTLVALVTTMIVVAFSTVVFRLEYDRWADPKTSRAAR